MVIGLLSWLYLGAQVTLLSAETNVVRVKRLWPRSLDPDDLTEADRRALKLLAEVEERRDEQEVDVSFDEDAGDERPEPTPDSSRGDAVKERARGKALITFGAGVLLGALGGWLRGRGPRDPQ